MSYEEILLRCLNGLQDESKVDQFIKDLKAKSEALNKKNHTSFLRLIFLFLLYVLATQYDVESLTLLGISFGDMSFVAAFLPIIYAYYFMVHTYIMLDESVVANVLNNFWGSKDSNLLYYFTGPHSMYYTERMMQAHFSEYKWLNKISLNLSKQISDYIFLIPLLAGGYIAWDFMNSGYKSELVNTISTFLLIPYFMSFMNLWRNFKVGREWN